MGVMQEGGELRERGDYFSHSGFNWGTRENLPPQALGFAFAGGTNGSFPTWRE